MAVWIKVLIGFILGIVVAIGIPFLILATGAIDWGATARPGRAETAIANWALDRSLERRVSKESNPFGNQPAAIEAGLDHYRENCVFCHGAPGVARSEAGKGLNTGAPRLDTGAQQMSDGEMFWIVQNGIRFSGMPAFGRTHTTNEIWQIISFTRRLPHLTADEVKRLSPEEPDAKHHH